MDIGLAIEALARELGLAKQALESELHQALVHAATAHYPDRELVMEFSEWGFELSQAFRVVERPTLPGDLSRASLQSLGFDCDLGERLVLPLLTQTSDLDEVPREVLVRGPVMPFEEMVTKRVLTRWLSQEGAARLRKATPRRIYGPQTSTQQRDIIPTGDLDLPEALLIMGRVLSFTPRADFRLLAALKDLVERQPERAELRLVVAGCEDPVRRPVSVLLGRVLAHHHVLDLPVGPLEVAADEALRHTTDADLRALWPEVCALFDAYRIEEDDVNPPSINETTGIQLIVRGVEHEARLVTGRIVACPNRDDIDGWDRLRYLDQGVQLRRGGKIESPPLVAVEGVVLGTARGGSSTRSPALMELTELEQAGPLFLLLSAEGDWDPPPRERDEHGNTLSVAPLELTDENPHLALEPSFRRPQPRSPARIRRVFLIDWLPNQNVVPLAQPQGPTGEATLQAFDEFLQHCRPDLEADMRLRPPASPSRIDAIQKQYLGHVPMSADLQRLYLWRDGQERDWPPLFNASRFSFLGLDDVARAHGEVERRLQPMGQPMPDGWILFGKSALNDYLLVERGGHGRVFAILHDGEPREQLWCVSESLLQFLHQEFRSRVQNHEAPCMLAEQLQFDPERLRRLSLQSLRRTNLEAAPRGTVIVIQKSSGVWQAYARVIPDRLAWVCAEASSRAAVLAMLDDGIHRRPRTEWQVGNPDDLGDVDGECLAWAGVMRITA